MYRTLVNNDANDESLVQEEQQKIMIDGACVVVFMWPVGGGAERCLHQ